MEAMFKPKRKRPRIIESDSESEGGEDTGVRMAAQLEAREEIELAEWHAQKWVEAQEFLRSLSTVEDYYLGGEKDWKEGKII
jgi:hypothetical protein